MTKLEVCKQSKCIDTEMDNGGVSYHYGAVYHVEDVRAWAKELDEELIRDFTPVSMLLSRYPANYSEEERQLILKFVQKARKVHWELEELAGEK